MKFPLYSQEGKQVGTVDGSDAIFGAKVKEHLIHKILTLQQSNKRSPIAHTLTKGEVSGGGKKPRPQKHSGRSRQGSTRNPHWKGGGVALGPRSTQNFTLRASKGERRNALLSALSSKAQESLVAALEGFESEKPKTQLFATMLKNLPFEKKVLFVLPEKNDVVYRSARNIPRVKTITVNYLNIADLLSYQNIVFFKEAFSKLESIFLK